MKKIARALRLPFITASVLPFIFGSLITQSRFNAVNFLLGLISVVTLHLSANLINDYADSKSGTDWKDKRFYIFFGGSKLIQEGVFSEIFYLRLSILFAFLASVCAVALSIRLQSMLVIFMYLLILALAWLYSMKPFKLSYRRCGEAVILLLFGPALVMGGFFLQTKIFSDFKIFLLSLPFGFLTTAILFANEVPDYHEDMQSHKHTLVSVVGREKAYIYYIALVFCAFFSLITAVFMKYLDPIALLSLACIPLSLKAMRILRFDYGDKAQLMKSSRFTIAAQTSISMIMLFSIVWPRLLS